MKEEHFLNIISRTIPESAGFLGDDTAYIEEKDLILTQDTLIEDIHFRIKTISPFYLGRKSIAVNLSDIAASGGIPAYVLISLSMPKTIEDNFVKEFYKGIRSICSECNVLVAGGDLTAAEKITISVCAVGFGNGLTPANRRTAMPGDVVIITGNSGSSATGLYLLEEFYKQTGVAELVPKEIRTKFINSHIAPVPGIKQGRKILETAKNPAMIDTSDGLADALYKICNMSKVSMEIYFDEIPYDPDIKKIFESQKAIQEKILFGGEDYELVAVVSEDVYKKLKQEIFVKKIGTVKQADPNCFAHVKFKSGDDLKIDSKSLNSALFKHFEE